MTTTLLTLYVVIAMLIHASIIATMEETEEISVVNHIIAVVMAALFPISIVGILGASLFIKVKS